MSEEDTNQAPQETAIASASRQTMDEKILEFTAQIVSAHLSNNNMNPDSIPDFIERVREKLSPPKPEPIPEPAPEHVAEVVNELVPAVPVDRSVFPDFIICLEDGKKLKMLKRHLNNKFNMTPEQYRAKWGLPYDYPMVTENYAKRRSKLALDLGLGRKPGTKIKKDVTEDIASDEGQGGEATADVSATTEATPVTAEATPAPDFAQEPTVKKARGRAKKAA